MMKNILITLVFLSTALFAQQNFTLEQSLDSGLKNSKEIHIAESRLKQAEAKVDEIWSGRMPKFALSAAYAHLSDVPAFEVNLPILPNPVKIQDVVLNTYNISVGFTQPLFTGFKLSSVQSAAEKMRDAAEHELKKAQNEKALEIREAFWLLNKTGIYLALIDESVALLEKHLQDTENYMDNGLATVNDVLRIKVRLADTQLKRVEAANQKELAKTLFNKSIGIDLNTDTRLMADTTFNQADIFSLDDLLSEALQNRSELHAIMLQTEAAGYNSSAAKSDWYPQIFAFGNYQYSNPNQRYLPVKDEFNDSWDVGVSLQWSIWDWGGRSAKSEQARQQVIQAENGYALAKESIQTDVRKNYLDLLNQKQRLVAGKLYLESAEENYRTSNEKYDVQLITSTELIDAEVSLHEAKTIVETAKVDYEIARIRLLKSVGRKIY